MLIILKPKLFFSEPWRFENVYLALIIPIQRAALLIWLSSILPRVKMNKPNLYFNELLKFKSSCLDLTILIRRVASLTLQIYTVNKVKVNKLYCITDEHWNTTRMRQLLN